MRKYINERLVIIFIYLISNSIKNTKYLHLLLLNKTNLFHQQKKQSYKNDSTERQELSLFQ